MSKKNFPKRKPEDSYYEDGDTASRSLTNKPSAKRKIMDILARGNRSVVELERKLATYEYSDDEIAEAIEFAQASKWISPPEALTEQIVDSLNRKKKSAQYIEQYLADKGLTPPEVDPEAEFEKALDVVRGKLAKDSGFDFEEKNKIQSLLTNRGFDSDTITKILDRK